MVEYKCNKCGKLYKNKTKYTRHIKRIYPCVKEVVEPQVVNKPVNNKQCPYCYKVFARPYNLKIHVQNRCKTKKRLDQENNNNNNDLIAKLMQENEQQKEKLDAVYKNMEVFKKEITQLLNNKVINNTQNVDNIQNNTVNNIKIADNIQNNTVNNIKIVAYGKEDLSHLLDKDYKMILNKGLKSVPAVVEAIHLNSNKPENHNIYISNMRDNYVKINDGVDWQLKETDDVLDDMMYEKSDMLNEKFVELMNDLDATTITKFNRYLENKDEEKVMDNIKKDLKLLLYNKRKIVEKTINNTHK